MRVMNEAVEGARDFREFMEQVMADERLAQSRSISQGATEDVGVPLGLGRQPGENRAAHRARLKRERRAGKVAA